MSPIRVNFKRASLCSAPSASPSLLNRVRSPLDLRAHFSSSPDPQSNGNWTKRYEAYLKRKFTRIYSFHRSFIESSEKRGNAEEDETVFTRERLATVPNMLSLFRIAATPVIGYLVVREQFFTACILFTVSGFTDMMDGLIARRYPTQRSLFGSIIDPIADKFLISTLFVTLAYMSFIPVFVTSVVLARDLSLVVGGLVLRYRMLEPPVTFRRFFDTTVSSVRIQPSTISKVNTVLQLLLVSTTLVSPIFQLADHPALHCLQFLTVCTTIWSGMQYALRSGILRVRRKRKDISTPGREK